MLALLHRRVQEKIVEFAGEFETHITVHLTPSEDIEPLKAWANAHGLKCLHILLDQGESASQPMLTRWGRGTLSGEQGVAEDLCKALAVEGFVVTRLKIEAAPTNEDIPQSPTDAVKHSKDRYFEHHIKLLLRSDTDIPLLTYLAQQYNAHLSRNVLRKRSDAYQERFVTQRCYGVCLPEARQQLDTLLTALAPLGHEILEIEQEFVAYDSNLALDAGWLKITEESNKNYA